MTRWLFICSCIALVTSAFTFVVRGDVMQALGDHFYLTQSQKGGVEGAVFIGMALSMLGGGFICDALGMKRIMWLAFLCHLAGSLGTVLMGTGFSPVEYSAGDSGAAYWALRSLSFIMGCGNGFTEVAINPLVATLFPLKKTHYLNILHAWWPGGLVIGGISARLVGKGGLDLGLINVNGLGLTWQYSLMLIVIPTIVYGLMLIPSIFPRTERVESGVSNAEMFKACLRPMFFLMAFCMLLTAATELGPQKWQESVMMSLTGGNVSGTLVLVYTSGMMFVLRHFAGPLASIFSPTGMMMVSAAIAGVGLYLLSFATNTATAFGYATIFGLGIAYFWPTMLGITAERFPKGGALALALMGSVGNLSVAYAQETMGVIVDTYSVANLEKNAPNLAETFVITKDGRPEALNTDEVVALETAICEQLLVIQERFPAINERIVANPRVLDLIQRTAASENPDPNKLKPQALAKGALNIAEINALAAESEPVARLNQLLVERAPVRAAEAAGFSAAFQYVSLLPVLLVVLFGGIVLYDRSRGGYKPEILLSKQEHDDLYAGGAEGEVQ